MEREDADKLLISASLTLFIVIAILFLAYFIITNNSYFILYAFPIFVIIGVLASASKNLIEYELIAALSFIVGGSIIYAIGKSAFAYYGLFSLAAFIVISLLVKDTKHKIYAYSILALPDALYFLSFWKNVNFSINAAIIGYYLLIGAVISLFISVASEESKWHQKFSKAITKLPSNKRVLYTAIVVFMLLLVLPLWPTGRSISLNELPNAQITINSTFLKPVANSSNYSYNIMVSYQKFENYTTANFSNVQLYYKNGKKLNATLHQINDTYNYSINMSLNYSNIAHGNSVYLYFMPYNFSNYTIKIGKPISNTTFVAKNSISDISYVGSYISKSIKEPIPKRITSNKNINTYAYPYYQFSSYCAPGYNITYNISFSFNHSASFFELRNSSDFMKAIGNVTSDNYNGYLKSFSIYSFAKFINVSRMHNIYYSNNSCLSYATVTKNILKVNATINTTSDKVFAYVNKTIILPNLYMNLSRYISNTYSFVWGGVSYINSQYANYTLNKSK